MKFITGLWRGLTHNADGTFSSTKFWQCIGYIAATFIVIKMTLNGNLGTEMFLVYVGAITAARSFQNYLSAKGKQSNKDLYSSNEKDYEFEEHYGSRKTDNL
jgi:hypothetical protein